MTAWKALKRHPLSGDYKDIGGHAWKLFVANLKKHGIVGHRKITLHEGQILDGWQLFRGCVELGIEPDFETLPEGVSPETFVETRNDTRRHETADEAASRIEARRKRVAEARTSGESIRVIAENEGVSHTTVKNDIEAATVKGFTVDPPNGKSTGKDGKSRPATNPPPILCARCQRVGVTKDCSACIEARKPKETRPPPQNAKRNSKSGREKFNWRGFDTNLGVVARGPDDVARAFPGEKGSNEYKACLDAMKEFTETWKQWQKRLSKL